MKILKENMIDTVENFVFNHWRKNGAADWGKAMIDLCGYLEKNYPDILIKWTRSKPY